MIFSEKLVALNRIPIQDNLIENVVYYYYYLNKTEKTNALLGNSHKE